MAMYEFVLAGFKTGNGKPVEEAIGAVQGVRSAAMKTVGTTPTVLVDYAGDKAAAVQLVNTAVAHLHIIAVIQ
ncbi:hypothetical protein GmRootV59_13290 [Variovorax sp. V59]|uniref:hypothetical protein n=1 Tax=unclassified Variovorax TaxID=663243 RepID=UPI0034E8B54D